MKVGNSGGYLLPSWRIFCNDKNNNGKITNFIRATKTRSPTSDSGATSLPSFGDAFMYIETSGGNYGYNHVFASFERIDVSQITNITFYYNRFSISDSNLRSMGRFRIQLLLEDNTWSTHYAIAKNTQYSVSSTECSLLILDFTVENCGIKIIYDQIDSPHADMCFSNITITPSVYKMNNSKYFKEIIESIQGFGKIVLLLLLFQNDKNLLKEIGFTRNIFNLLKLEFKNNLLEGHEEYLDYIKNEEESNLEKFLNL